MLEFQGQTTGTETIVLASVNIELGKSNILRFSIRGQTGIKTCGTTGTALVKNVNNTVTGIGGSGGVMIADAGFTTTVNFVVNGNAVQITVDGTAQTLIDWTAFVEVL